jgi:parvulin-like peptidyl-prolyl isomerase
MSIRRTVGVALAAVAVLGTGCSGGDGPPKVAAVVEGNEIPSTETEQIVEAYLRRQADQAPDQALPRDEIAKYVLEYQIKLALVEHLASSLGVDAAPEAVFGDAAGLIEDEDYRRIGQRQEDFARELQAGQLSQAMAKHLYPEISISETAVAAEYERRAPLLDRAWKATADLARFRSEEPANQLKARVEQGEAFADAARALGADEVATSEINPVVAPLPASVLDAVGTLPPGGVSGPLPAGGGFMVARVERRQPVPRLTLDDVRAEITEFLVEQERGARFQEWFQQQFTKADVEVNSYYGEWDPESTLVE